MFFARLLHLCNVLQVMFLAPSTVGKFVWENQCTSQFQEWTQPLGIKIFLPLGINMLLRKSMQKPISRICTTSWNQDISKKSNPKFNSERRHRLLKSTFSLETQCKSEFQESAPPTSSWESQSKTQFQEQAPPLGINVSCENQFKNQAEEEAPPLGIFLRKSISSTQAPGSITRLPPYFS